MAEEKKTKKGEKRKCFNVNSSSPDKKDYHNVSYTDFMCPICLQLLIQPVVMPCKHELCMPCFQNHVEATSLSCPMCRIRISSWARKKGREGALVDEERWNIIQKLFPEKCKRRLNGEDDEEDDDIGNGIFAPIVAEQGELRKEYEHELLKVELEKQEELKASEDIIRKLQEEEKERQEKLKEDELIAKQLQQEELINVGDKFASPNTKLNHFLEVCKLPKEIMLRSNSGNGNAQKESKGDQKSCLTNWLSKSSQGSPGTSTESRPPETTKRTPVRTRQEQEDYDMAFRLQRELDVEHKRTPKGHTLREHFYPLRQRNSNEKLPAKRLKTN